MRKRLEQHVLCPQGREDDRAGRPPHRHRGRLRVYQLSRLAFHFSAQLLVLHICEESILHFSH